jgi:hypothetical protein
MATKKIRSAISYCLIKEELYTLHGIIFRKQQIVVPKSLRGQLLRNMHLDHTGLTRTLSKVRQSVYWPGITNDVKNVIGSCYACQSSAKSNVREPMIPSPLPEYLFQRISMDYFEDVEKKFLIMLDGYSHWFYIYMVKKNDSDSLIKILTSHFAEHGTPEQLCSDNGPPFHSKRFKEFCDQKGIKHISSSPRYPRSNGLVERTIQTAKKMISRYQASGTPVDVALIEHRNTPFTENMPSPSELALGRKLRTPFPHKKSDLTLHGYPREDNKFIM